MGQNSSVMNRIALQLESAIVKLESHAVALKEETNLKKETFQTLITELNKAVAGITDSKGCRLQFNVVAGTMDGHSWKSTVRVDSWRIDAMTTSVCSQCRFTLRQFQTLYDELMFMAARATSTADAHKLKFSSGKRDESQSGRIVTGSQVGESTDDDVVEAGPADEFCSLCQENSTDLSLSCGHCYCQGCLEKWLHVAGKSQAAGAQQSGDCPLCKPTKEYEALLKARAARGGAPLRVRVSPEMADELTSLPDRIHAEFAQKRKGKKRGETADKPAGIQRLGGSELSCSDDEDDCAGASKDPGALARAKQLFGLVRSGGEARDTDNLLSPSAPSLGTSFMHGNELN